MAFTLQIGAVAFALGAAVVAYVVRRQEQNFAAKAAAAVNAQRLGRSASPRGDESRANTRGCSHV